MKKLSITNDFKSIVLNDIKLIDVRAPIEYEKGAMINSINLPILTNEERHIIGICYKEKGNEEATKLGHEIVSNNIKEDRVNSWAEYCNENIDAMIYCFRGGSRSTIAQRWIYEATGKDVVKLDGGYKVFRNYLIDSLEPENITAKPIVLTGYTGSGKTEILKLIDNAIDLEGIANHRGSTFGHFITPQPTQINFENNLAYKVIKHKEEKHRYMVVEDESKSIGRNFIPKNFYNHCQKGDVVFVEATIDERVDNIIKDYVVNAQKEHIEFYNDKEAGMTSWYNDMLASMERVRGRVGGDRIKVLIDEFNLAYEGQRESNSFDAHKKWIELFLTKYYDPMYKHSIEKASRNIIFKGDTNEVIEYLKKLEG